MKTKILIATVSLFLIFHSAPQLRGQGALTPPGAPAPTMKSLAQIEPRTPVDGVALAAIQALNQKREETRAENTELKQYLAALEKIILNQKSN
jgi:hypothetical protein